MARKNLINVEIGTGVYNIVELQDLIPQYGEHKTSLDDMDKVCKKENTRIKELMKFYQKDSMESEGWKVSYSVSERTSMNEDKLLEILKEDWISRNGSIECPYIKTKEYVDMDLLEDALYKDEVPKDVILKMKTCEESKQVETLRISKMKEADK